MTRREARIEAMQLLFELDFQANELPANVYARALDAREFEEDEYLKDLFFGVCDHSEKINEIIAKYSAGWSVQRISHVSHAVMQISVYEMLYRTDVPVKVSLNEAVELTKIYDDEKAKPFVNGILNAIKNDLDQLSDAN